jgi:hypothetical protein
VSSWGSRRGVPRRVRERILARDAICQLQSAGCLGVPTEIDHVIGVAELGGYINDDDENLRGVCRSCHRARSDAQRNTAIKTVAARRYARRHLPVQRHPGEMR